jgi:hypothetical protein
MFRKLFRSVRWKAKFSKGNVTDREQMRIMVFGHNSNLKIGNITFHVQTEDRGESHALIDTTVYYHGRVLYRRTNNYFDLLPLDDDRQQALKLRLEDQHRTVIEDIRSGELQLTVPTIAAAQPAPSVQVKMDPPIPAAEPKMLILELTNAKSWLSGKHAKLQLTVRQSTGEPISGAQISVQIEGSEDGVPFKGETGISGEAQIEFEMPKITGPQAALVVYAEDRSTTAQLRFALRAKPRIA